MRFNYFYNKYRLSKTLRFSLVPVGETSKHLAKAIEEGNRKAEAYTRVKVMLDELHRKCINDILNKFAFSLDQLNGLYNAFEALKARNEDAQQKYIEIQSKLTKDIKDFIGKYEPKPIYMKKNKKGQEIIAKNVITLLEELADENSQKQKDIEEFRKYTAYLEGYNTCRKYMYKNNKMGNNIIADRVMRNLGEHINNVWWYEQIKDKIADSIKQLNNELQVDADTVFSIRYFNKVLTQDGINLYNMLIAGRADQEGVKVKGINEYINEYNAVHKQSSLPKLTQLYKQILSNINSESFRYAPIENEKELFEIIDAYYSKLEKHILQSDELKELFETSNVSEYDIDKIYVKVSAVNTISAKAFQNWKFISAEMANKFGSNANIKKIIDILADEENRKPKTDNIKLSWLKECLSDKDFTKIMNYLDAQIKSTIKTIKQKRKLYDKNKRANVKDLLDAIKQLHDFMSFFKKRNADDTDIKFYNTLDGEKCKILDEVVSIYNKARNVLTKKPYSLRKIKLNFSCSTLLDGWDLNKEADNLSIILRKNGIYYLGIINKDKKNVVLNKFRQINQTLNGECFEKMNYKQISGACRSLPKKFFSDKGKKEFNPSTSLLANHDQKHHRQQNPDFDINFLRELIDFYKKAIEQCEWKEYNFTFKDTTAYQNIDEFYKDVDEQAYKISFSNIPATQVLDLVNDGMLYLFKIHNKDFSPYSHGTPNLHTIYWKALFDEDNLKDVVYKLNGQAEIFWREKSIKDENIIKHNANEKIQCRRKDRKKISTFTYDLIKDKRFTEDKYMFHVPITLNFKADGETNIDQQARTYIKEHVKDISIIGIDRGERNLLYYSLIDMNGNIKEQGSLNTIDDVDYNKLLIMREKERKKSRQNWTEIGKIKDLKAGYLSQAIHKITGLMIKHNAMIVLENLSYNFKRSRIKIEHSVYQKFEKMIIDKLNYLVIKNQKEKMTAGGLMRAYQLASLQTIKNSNYIAQSGFLFYVSPWMTTNIDPTTGFINFFETDYKSINKSKEFVRDFVDIRYNREKKYFEFETHKTSKFIKQSMKRIKNLKTDWVICSYGDRIIHYKESNHFKFDQINMTQKLRDLFYEYHVRLDHIREDIDKIDAKEFFECFMRLFGYVVQMRNTNCDNDYILSPVRNKDGTFFDSRECNYALPENADANGAYNIARKGLLIVEKIRNSTENLPTKKKENEYIKITDEEWIKFAQKYR